MSYSSTDAAIAAAQASINRSRAAPAGKTMGDSMLTGAAVGAVVSLPLAGVGLVTGAIVGAGVAALTKD